MRPRRDTDEASIGLFAFLDVLMCTMGALILLLVVVTPKIRREAVAKQAAETLPVAASVVPLPAIDRGAALRSAIQDLSAKAARRRTDLASSQAAADELRRRQVEARQTAATLDSRLAGIQQARVEAAQKTAELAALGVEVDSKLAASQVRLRKLQGEIARASTAFRVLAYDGVSGTPRRPVLIECSRESIKFLQEDIALDSAELSGFTPAFNPLLAGAQALVDYWTSHSNPDEPRPYVLLVVRPSGSVAYHYARRMLERMKEPFGYELLDASQPLKVPERDAEAAAACRRAIDSVLQRRMLVAKRNAIGGGNAGGGGSGNAGGNGGSGELLDASKPSGLFDDPVQAIGTGDAPVGERERALSAAKAERAKSPAAPATIPGEQNAGAKPLSEYAPQSGVHPLLSEAARRGPEPTSEQAISRSAARGVRGRAYVDPADPTARPMPTASGEPGQIIKRTWGIANPRGTIGFEHDVTIYVEAERVIVADDSPITCGRGESSDELSNRVIASLERTAHTWGRPPENFYWVPAIKFVISPGGNQHYERIRSALGRHGLESMIEHRLDATKASTPKGGE